MKKFVRGEILTAEKLNDALSGRRLTVAGDAATSYDADGDVVRVDGNSNIYSRLTSKTGTNPIKYAWTEVYRNANGTWSNTTNNGTTTGDYAIELNNSNLSTSDNYVYRAERSPESGEWLFFLRRSATAITPIRVVSILTANTALSCSRPDIESTQIALSPSAPSCYQIANVTLRMQDYNGNWSVLKTWTDYTASDWGNYTFTPPYEPTASNWLLLELTGSTAQGTLLGRQLPECANATLCGTEIQDNIYYNSGGSTATQFHGPVTAYLTNATSNRTTSGGNVTLSITSVPTGNLTNLPPRTFTGPAQYKFKMDWSCSGGSCNSNLTDFLNGEYTTGMTVSGDGASGSTSSSQSFGLDTIARAGTASYDLGYVTSWGHNTTWPPCDISYNFGVVKETVTVTVTKQNTPTKSITATGTNTYYNSPVSSPGTVNVSVPTTAWFLDSLSNNYTMNNGNGTPQGTC